MSTGTQTAGDDKAARRPTRRKAWSRPRILLREPLEAVAVACVPTVNEGGPGKPDVVQCSSPQS